MLPGVSKTAILTLRARADEHARADRVLTDPIAAEWYAKVDWPSELDFWYDASAQSSLAFRADDIDRIVRRYQGWDDPLTLVELGCGLSTRRQRLADLELEAYVELDLPEVIALRERWGVRGGIASSVLDLSWLDRLDGRPFFLAEGLLYYLPRAEVDRLLGALRAKFPGAPFLFDLLGRNDHPALLESTRKVGTPIQWRYDAGFDEALDHFGLATVEGFEPELLMNEALERYWARFDERVRVGIYYAQHNPALWAGRSGMILGRL
jgi:O-methyltransferase involved in polyketide biosynthesis